MANVTIEWQPHETTFKGESIKMEIRPLKNWAWFEIAPLLNNKNPKKQGESKEDYIARLTDEEKLVMGKDSIKLQHFAKTIFPEHVRNLSGVTVNNQAPTNEHLSEEVVFLSFTVGIIMKLIEISSLDEEDTKNLNGPSESEVSDSKETR